MVFEEIITCNYNSYWLQKTEIHKFFWEGEQLLQWLNERQNTTDFCRGKFFEMLLFRSSITHKILNGDTVSSV